jgi:hypothetical protein
VLAGEAFFNVYGDSTSKYLLFMILLSCIHTGGPWRKSNITYAVRSYPSSKRLRRSAVDEELEKALTTWADVAKLNFLSVSNSESADITVTFVSRAHGDRNPFDGKGMVLAHAYAPPSGEVHFDDDEPWTIRKNKGEIMLHVQDLVLLGCDIASLDTRFPKCSVTFQKTRFLNYMCENHKTYIIFYVTCTVHSL